MEKPRVGIYGFGRIGMSITRANIKADYPLDIAAVSDVGDTQDLVYLLNHDSTHGSLEKTTGRKAEAPKVSVGPAPIVLMQGDIREATLKVLRFPHPSQTRWSKEDIRYVVDATGKFAGGGAGGHKEMGGASCVIVSQPTDHFPSVIAGINDEDFDPREHPVLDAASCTTHALAPLAKVLDGAFGIEEGFMSGVHAVTNSQPVLDAVRQNEKSRRGLRGAMANFYPYPSGAARAIGKVLPRLEGKLSGDVVRVPVADVSLVELTARLQKSCTVDDIREVLGAAAEYALHGVLRVEDEELVSSDFLGDPHDSIVDSSSIMVSQSGRTARVRAFYDNETGYANGVIRLIRALHEKRQ